MILSKNNNPDTGKKLTVGGQAVIEGVMMRSPWRVATAVRHPDGSILVKAAPFVSLSKQKKLISLPVIRGAVGLFEAMKIGIASLNWSAEIASEQDDSKPMSFWDKVVQSLVMLFSFAVGIGLFMAVPYFVAGLFPNTENQVYFHLIAGSLRILLLIGYMAAISFIPDITEVFRYHGAEHKSIFAFEKKLDLNVQNASCQSRFHPRCGTSFLLLAAILTMLGFMLIDSVLVYFFGDFRNVLHRVVVHLPFLPLVAGVSFEFLRWVEKHSEERAWQPLVLPGFMLQRITTREPNPSHVEVALAALEEALLKQSDAYLGPPREHAEQMTEPSLAQAG